MLWFCQLFLRFFGKICDKRFYEKTEQKFFKLLIILLSSAPQIKSFVKTASLNDKIVIEAVFKKSNYWLTV